MFYISSTLDVSSVREHKAVLRKSGPQLLVVKKFISYPMRDSEKHPWK